MPLRLVQPTAIIITVRPLGLGRYLTLGTFEGDRA